ncbi:hypothetical protein C0584_05815 [Candidatus Parcubacteria bacterium]|nr:MAG: hypothetical protein C0584_05815 [Candidatus Parcubacteria bacterium]
MFKKDEEVNIKNTETVIGQSIKVKGNFFGDGDIVVEGKLEGAIKTSNNLLVGPKAIIKADVEAKTAKISGEITGNVVVENFLEITSTAKINGDISASQISVESGAVFNGNCLMTKVEEKIEEKKDEIKK